MNYDHAVAELRKQADPLRATHSQRYFKTGPGQYGEGDQFWGLTVPQLHRLAQTFSDLPLPALDRLLASEIHEQRLLAVLVLRRQFVVGTPAEQAAIYRFYVAHLARINNWDLVDGSAPYIVGAWLQRRSRKPLYQWARSNVLWERRVAIVATLWFIRDQDFTDTFALAERLLGDHEDLMHKAVGWMLREVDKRDHAQAVAFLQRHYTALPRTSLRYAIERFAPAERRAAMRGEFTLAAQRPKAHARQQRGVPTV